MAQSKQGKKPTPTKYTPNFWGMLRDVLIASINKGQFPAALIGLIIVILICKVPNVEVIPFLREITALFVSFHLLGWGLFVITAGGWYFSARYLRKLHTDEIRRISNERTKLQSRTLKKRLKSSN